jgi:hypothetical protein
MARVSKRMCVSAGISTGGNDPRSSNQTLGNTFDTPDLRLDYAYGEIRPLTWATIRAGKLKGIKAQIFRPSDLLWDSDINPEGLSLLLKGESDRLTPFTNAGLWVLDELHNRPDDPYMYVVQPGIQARFSPGVHATVAMTYYGFEGVRQSILEHSSWSNTTSGNVLVYDYDAVNPSLDVRFIPGGVVPFLGFFGEGVMTFDPDSQNIGYLGGIKFGAPKVKDCGQWQFTYMYRHLERDAWLDAFPDSDAYAGWTGVQGHEMIFEIGVGRRASLALDCYAMEPFDGTGNLGLVQVDLNLKF